MRSSALASLLRYEGRRTRLFKRAEAAIMELYGEEGRVSTIWGEEKEGEKAGEAGIQIVLGEATPQNGNTNEIIEINWKSGNGRVSTECLTGRRSREKGSFKIDDLSNLDIG